MLISRREGNTTTTIHVDTGFNMLLGLFLLVVGFGLFAVSVQHPVLHPFRLLTGVGLFSLGWVLARRTLRFIRMGTRAYNNSQGDE